MVAGSWPRVGPCKRMPPKSGVQARVPESPAWKVCFEVGKSTNGIAPCTPTKSSC